jgi:F-type H+-transporting ATPase subunit delta
MKASKKIRRAARQLYRACLVDGRLDAARVRLVAERLAGSKQRGALALLTDFQRLVRLDSDRNTAIVESAAPLVADVREGLQAELARKYGPRLVASFADNPALIGGMRIRVGSDVYDSSVRAKLAALASRL